jgi:UDP-glucose-4-epimerase GalE
MFDLKRKQRRLGVRILVTGGAGYVGSHAVRELAAAGNDVVIYDNFSTGHWGFCEGYEVIRGDIADRERLTRALVGVEGIIHLAASAYVGESMQNPRKYFRNNVEAVLQLLDAVLASDVTKFVCSSSCAVYGTPETLPVAESSRKEPISAYGATKLFLEHALSAYGHSHGLKHVCLRYFNAAGAAPEFGTGECHDPETHLIPLALKAALGTGPMLRIFGDDFETSDGTCVRDFVHVRDLARAHVNAMEYLEAGGSSVSLNLGTGMGTSIRSLIETIEEVTALVVPHEYVARRPGDPAELYAESSLARTLLGWKPQFDLRATLETAWKWETHGLPMFLASPVGFR